MAKLGERLDPARLARLGSLPIKARVIVESALGGLHRASVHGASVEFTEHKEYSPGDELRHLDWKTYAKRDRFYVKQFEQESQLTVFLVLDASGSMAFAGDGPSKLEVAGLLLAAIAYLAIEQHDRVGVITFGDRRIETLVPPRSRKNHLHDVLTALDSVIAQGATGDESSVSALARVAELTRRQRSLIVLASDLFDLDDGSLTAICQMRAQRHDVSVLHVLDRHELEFPFTGLTRFESLERADHLLVNPGAVRREYLQRLEAFLTRCQATFVDAGVEYQRVATDHPPESALLSFLTSRARFAPAATRRAR